MNMSADRKFFLFRVIVRTLAAVGVLAVVAGLAAKALAPSGTMTVTTDLADPAPFISQPIPSDRVGQPEGTGNDRSVALLGNPVYLDVTPPAAFDYIGVAVTYVNDGQPDLQIGALASSLDNLFDMRPAENRPLDSLSWDVVTSGRLTLYQREKRYVSIDDFYAHPPEFSAVAVYGADSPARFRLKDYVAADGPRVIDANLRGSQRLLTYVKNETLNFQFTVQDMNRLVGPDPVVVSVYRQLTHQPDGREEQPIARTTLVDDGNVSTDQKSSKLRTVSISAVGLEEGSYRLEFTTSDDVFIRKITTSQGKLAFAGRIYLGDIVGYSDIHKPVAVYTDGSLLTAVTAHPDSQQTIKAGDGLLKISEPHVRYSRTLPGNRLVAVMSPLGDVMMEADGAFSLTKGEFFDPLPYGLSWTSTTKELNERGVDYIIADYEPLQVGQPTRTARVEFETARLALTDDGAYRFAISAPGIEYYSGQLRIRSVTFTMRRRAVTWAEAWDRFANRAVGGNSLLILPSGKSFGETPN